MTQYSDQIFQIAGGALASLPARSMRKGVLGKTLEDALQTLLEKYPQVIPGSQISPSSDDPPQFVLLRREMPVGGWSLDHLYLDQHAVLTLVETKLFENPQSRREVIGQIIEYAANAWEHWGNGKARQAAIEFYSKDGRDLNDLLQSEFGEELDLDDLWSDVEKNLERGRIRLIIAADELRPEVRRMIEYLNGEMRNADIFGLELSCYGDNSEDLVLVPRLMGQTQASADRRAANSETIRWTVERLWEALSEIPDPILEQRLGQMLSTAIELNAFKESMAKRLTFGILGRTGKRLFTMNTHGGGYITLYAETFEHGETERDAFISDLQTIGILEAEIDIDAVKDGKYFKKSLVDLDPGEFESLLKTVRKYCN